MADITFSLLYAERWVFIGTLSGGGVEIKLKEEEMNLQHYHLENQKAVILDY